MKLDSFFEYNSKLNASDKVEEKDDIFETAESQKSTTQNPTLTNQRKSKILWTPFLTLSRKKILLLKTFPKMTSNMQVSWVWKSLLKFEEIKPTYRKIIAQYHPDRVVAMGPEIKEVAEKKAKEINEAYEQLRKNLNIS